MKAILCLIIAAGLYGAALFFNQRFVADTEAAVKAPMRIGEGTANNSLDDPREVAETFEGKRNLAQARSYGTYCKLCVLGSSGFMVLAVAQAGCNTNFRTKFTQHTKEAEHVS